MAGNEHKDKRIDIFVRRLSIGVTLALLILLAVMTMTGRKAGDGGNAVAPTNPALISHVEKRVIPVDLEHPRGLALRDDGGFCVVGDSGLMMISLAGKVIRSVPLDGEANCVALLADGRIVVGFSDHLALLGTDGGVLKSWPAPDSRSLFTAVAVSGDDIWVADAGQRLILRYNSVGKIVGMLGKTDPARHVPGLVVPSPYLDIATAKDGLFVTNPGRHVVEKYAVSGEMLASWGSAAVGMEGFAGCCNPTSIALLPDGRVVTAEKGIPRVKIYSSAGVFESVVAGAELFLPGTVGIDLTVDKRGTIFLLDPMMKAVRVFEAKGKG